MGILDDLAGAHRAASAWLDGALNTARTWAASEDGQLTLLGLDYLAISSKVGDFYEHVGWYLPVHPTLLRYAVEHVETHAPFDARRAAGLVGPSSKHWRWITEGVMATPTLESRRPIIADAIFCLEHERWHAAVSTLLPVIEGVVADRSGVLKDMRVGRRLDQILHRQTGPLDALSAVPALEVIDIEVFHGHDFAAKTPADEGLNRHLVLHGRTAGFGTRINAVRTFMLVIALAELFDGALVFRAPSSPVDEGSLLDEYGPLAEIRRAARRSAAEVARARS